MDEPMDQIASQIDLGIEPNIHELSQAEFGFAP